MPQCPIADDATVFDVELEEPPRDLVASTVTGNAGDENVLRVNYYILIVISSSPYQHITSLKFRYCTQLLI